MAAVPTSFYCLWQDNNICEALFALLSKEDLAAVRAANTACCNLLTKRLFLRTHVTFTSSTFTRPVRVQALARIGHHIEHLTFFFPHSDATFLPPLIHPESGHEITFLYTPHTSIVSALSRPKYTNSELGDILTAQYPPLFHAATNVPSFINAMKHMPNMRHLTVKTPHQDPRERYRRDIVDYALISLRVSLERSPLDKLHKLSLVSVHPAAFLYFRPLFTLGCRPSAMKRWRQIRKLHISVESWDFYSLASPGLDHLRIMDSFIRTFEPSLEKLSFTWVGRKGPCPFALQGDPLLAPPKSSKKLFNEVTSPMSPLPPPPPQGQMHFPRLKFMQVRNATMNAPQISVMVGCHRETVREFDFDNVALTHGTWDVALAPLTDKKAYRSSRGTYHGLTSRSEVWARSVTNLNSSFSGLCARSNSEEDFSSPSAAVEAANRDLFDEELARNVLSLVGVEGQERRNQILEWAAKTPAPMPALDREFLPAHGGNEGEATEREHGISTPQDSMPPTPPTQHTGDFTHMPSEWPEIETDLASEIAAAKEASESFSTNLKKRKVKKKRRRRDKGDESGCETEKSVKSPRKHDNSERRRHKRKQSSSRSSSERREEPPEKPYQMKSCSHHKRTDSIPLAPESGIPDIPEVPEVLDDEKVATTPHVSNVLPPLPLILRSNTTMSNKSSHSQNSQKSARSFRSFKSFKSLRSRPSFGFGSGFGNRGTEDQAEEKSSISPAASFSSSYHSDSTQRDTPPTPILEISAPIFASSDEDPAILLLQPTVYDPSMPIGQKDPLESRASIHEITAVQRDLEAEEKHRLMAEDECARSNALRKAKERVMAKLSREFPFSQQPNEGVSKGNVLEQGGISTVRGGPAAIVRRKLMDYTFGHGQQQQQQLQTSTEARERVCEAIPWGHHRPARQWWSAKSAISVASECKTIDSQSALVPLIISRS